MARFLAALVVAAGLLAAPQVARADMLLLGSSDAVGGISCLAVADCFPKPVEEGAARTGIPVGTVLSSCGHHDTIVVDDTVIDGCEYTGSLTIQASGVEIRNTRIHERIVLQEAQATASFLVEDSEIGPDVGCYNFDTVVGVHRYTALRNYIHNVVDGFRVSADDVHIEGNFVLTCGLDGGTPEDPNDDDHSDGVQGFGGGQNVVFTHNTVDQSELTCCNTAPMFFADDSVSCACTSNLLIARSSSDISIRISDDNDPDVGPWVITGNRATGTKYTGNTECGAASMTWSNNRTVTVDGDYAITSTTDEIPCA